MTRGEDGFAGSSWALASSTIADKSFSLLCEISLDTLLSTLDGSLRECRGEALAASSCVIEQDQDHQQHTNTPTPRHRHSFIHSFVRCRASVSGRAEGERSRKEDSYRGRAWGHPESESGKETTRTGGKGDDDDDEEVPNETKTRPQRFPQGDRHTEDQERVFQTNTHTHTQSTTVSQSLIFSFSQSNAVKRLGRLLAASLHGHSGKGGKGKGKRGRGKGREEKKKGEE